MKLKILAVLCLPLLAAVPAKAQISLGMSFNSGDGNNFYLAVGQNFNVPQREVMVIRERHIPDEELPVIFFIASRAHVTPSEVANRRLAGAFYIDIVRYYRLSPSIFYVALDGDPGNEYSRAYDQWRTPRTRWSRMSLEDDDIIKMVNLQFVTKQYDVRPEEVVRLRDRHDGFVQVTDEVTSHNYRSSRETDGFYFAVGQNYNVTQRQVVVIRDREIPDEELPVIFFIASRARVTPGEVADRRLDGELYIDIVRYYRLNPSIFYVALNGDPGSEYRSVYEQWRTPRRRWARMSLEDDDIIKMVNLQFVSRHYGVRPEDVVRLRDQQGGFVRVINVVTSQDYRYGRGAYEGRGWRRPGTGPRGSGR